MTNFHRRSILVLGLFLCSAMRSTAAGTVPVRIALSDAMPPISFMEHGQANGMFREMLEALFEQAPGYRAEFNAYPWARAQWLLQNHQMDLFLTFPSQDRRKYAEFTRQAVFTLDYGNLVYRAGNSNADKILAANSFEDLRSLVFISQDMVAWEKENVPPFISRYSVHNPAAIMHMAYQRKTGDFFIMPVEQAIYYSNMLGYRKQLAIRKVDFIPNSQVPFHIGVRRSYSGGEQLLATLEAAMKTPGFQARRRAIEQKYRTLATAQAPQSGASRLK
ncbi:substrate-binding periplasmic protein [Pseudoduganella sp. OTU4001]|uniref:substrate-binding periplasmic protein n=1 Tax=Pseudoduganella sp. OTU4001 TaxID=3043854 RepID=UPI00313F0607